ncbi:TetR/AcrR family transcriptional regulator [Limnohabitans sp. 2KL-3]|uniref:TetR/AcrR family transcriptional regulator n=1 Tax=Limnohabitans sp. 2KL-3 TaxID=1100700 RepID=UPI001892C370|nr:TetR/AcrR family transcriptional regulator [Limnohabitans sp. 2KL-3]
MATPKSGSHQTRDKLLAATLDLLLTHLPQNITAQMVLEKSGISRGSLYHHFEDISALLEVALVQSFAKTVDKSLFKFEEIIKKAKNREEMLLELTKVTDATQQKSLRAIRFQRARLIVFSEDNPRLAKALAVEQQRLTDTIADLIGMAQERGWMFTGVDARSAAVLIQAYTLGMIVDDIVQEQMTQENWSALIHRLIQQVF